MQHFGKLWLFKMCYINKFDIDNRIQDGIHYKVLQPTHTNSCSIRFSEWGNIVKNELNSDEDASSVLNISQQVGKKVVAGYPRAPAIVSLL